MTLKDFIKQNFVLVVGMSMPVLLVLGFLLASALPKATAVPPQYEMLFTTTRYEQQNHGEYSADFFVKDGKLLARIWKNKNGTGSYAKKIMAYDAKTQSVREISYDLSKIGDVKDNSEILLNEFKDLRINNSTTSPDGYAFENRGYGGGWPITEIFGGGYHERSPRLIKGAAVFVLPENMNGVSYYGYDVQFLGWNITK